MNAIKKIASVVLLLIGSFLAIILIPDLIRTVLSLGVVDNISHTLGSLTAQVVLIIVDLLIF